MTGSGIDGRLRGRRRLAFSVETAADFDRPAAFRPARVERSALESDGLAGHGNAAAMGVGAVSGGVERAGDVHGSGRAAVHRNVFALDNAAVADRHGIEVAGAHDCARGLDLSGVLHSGSSRRRGGLRGRGIGIGLDENVAVPRADENIRACSEHHGAALRRD